MVRVGRNYFNTRKYAFTEAVRFSLRDVTLQSLENKKAREAFDL